MSFTFGIQEDDLAEYRRSFSTGTGKDTVKDVGFHKWWYPKIDALIHGKSYENG